VHDRHCDCINKIGSFLMLFNPSGTKRNRLLEVPVHTAQKTPSVSVIKTSQFTLYTEIIAFSSEIHTKHIGLNTLGGLNVEFLYVKAGGV
jgi:hypothetical protein